MPARKDAPPSFDAIIQADRQKRKNEALASQILGKNRRASAPGSGVGSKKTPAPGSLASRIGVAKRSASTSSKPKSTPAATVRSTISSRPGPVRSRRAREDRMVAAIDAKRGVNVNNHGNGIAIKGTGSGPSIVLASNFAPGTSAADIQSALEAVAGEIVSCQVTSHHPVVTAEIACAERWGAENVVANFNNQKADGRVLSMRLKGSQAASFNPPTGPRALTNGQSNQSAYDGFREQADRERRENRRADPQVQDGTYGFGQSQTRGGLGGGRSNKTRANRDQPTSGLYSDDLMIDAPPAQPSRRGRGFR